MSEEQTRTVEVPRDAVVMILNATADAEVIAGPGLIETKD